MAKISEIMLFQQPEQPILAIEVKTDLNSLSNIIGESYGKIGSYLEELGKLTTDVPFVAYLDYENMDESNISALIGFKLSDPLPGKDEIKSIILPSRKIIMCMHRGTYTELAALYLEMSEWIKTNNYVAESSSLEYYYNGPDIPESEHVTRVEMPLIN